MSTLFLLRNNLLKKIPLLTSNKTFVNNYIKYKINLLIMFTIRRILIMFIFFCCFFKDLPTFCYHTKNICRYHFSQSILNIFLFHFIIFSNLMVFLIFISISLYFCRSFHAVLYQFMKETQLP